MDEKSKITYIKDLWFVAFHLILITHSYNIYGKNLANWDNIQLILASILIVGDPVFYNIKHINFRNSWDLNLEPFLYYSILVVTSIRALFYSTFDGFIINFIAILGWILTNIFSPAYIFTRAKNNVFSNFSSSTLFLLISVFRGFYLAFLSSILPVARATRHNIFYPTKYSYFHFISTFFLMTSWTFLIIFIKYRMYLVIDVKKCGIWRKILEPSSGMHQRWIPDHAYQKGQIVYFKQGENISHYELLSDYSNSFYFPFENFWIQSKLESFLIFESTLDSSIVFRIFLTFLLFSCILNASVVFIYPKAFTYLINSVANLVIVFHTDHFFLK